MENQSCLVGAVGQQQLSEWVREEDTAYRTCRERNRAQDIGRISPFLVLLCVPVPDQFTKTLNLCHVTFRVRRTGKMLQGRLELRS